MVAVGRLGPWLVADGLGRLVTDGGPPPCAPYAALLVGDADGVVLVGDDGDPPRLGEAAPPFPQYPQTAGTALGGERLPCP